MTSSKYPKLLAAGLLAILTVGSVACGGADDAGAGLEAPNDNEDMNNSADYDAGGSAPDQEPDADDPFVPEEEEFLVREVATTSAHVFVPNSSEQSNTVAKIDGRDFSIRPIAVGQEPTVVRAASVDGVGDVAFALCVGDATVAIIRADIEDDRADGEVNLLPVPKEVNALSISPDGRHLLAYIDPSKPLREGTSVASLQTAALVRLGDEPADDEVFELSLTRLIDKVEFTADSEELFVIGREGINRIRPYDVDADTFVPPLPLELSSTVFPPEDLEVEVSPDGDFLVARSAEAAAVLVYQPPEQGSTESVLRQVWLSAIPTDIDLYFEEDGSPGILATLRGSDELALIDVDAVLAADEDTVPEAETIAVEEVQPGLAQLTPAGDQVLLYTSLVLEPRLGVLDFEDRTVRSYALRNQIRSVAISNDSSTAVVVHRKQDGDPPSNADPQVFFQHNHGVTLFDIETGYRRPIVLQGEPTDLVMTQREDDTALVYVMLESTDPNFRGVTRIDLQTYRTDFFRLARQPQQMGIVAGKVFVSQAADVGRITFFDVETGAQRTVSGYELNAGIE
jgi:hypothetical protein